MRNLISRNTLLLSHPLLVAVAPVLFLWGNNAGQITTGEALSWLALSVVATGLLQFVATKVLRRPAAAAIIVSTVVALFFLHGHCFDLLWNLEIAPRQRYVHAALLAMWVVVLALSVAYVVRAQSNLERLSTGVTLAATMLLMFSAVPLAYQGVAARWAAPQFSRSAPLAEVPAANRGSQAEQPPAVSPDIYYIILDGYARHDVLRKHYGFDNTEFLDYLRNRGFYVAERSCTNYPYTYLSLSSSLNMRYHDPREVHNPSEIYFYQMIHRPLAPELLQGKGYRYVHFGTNWAGTQVSQIADDDPNQTYNPLVGNLAVCLRQTTMARLWDGVTTYDFSPGNQSTFDNLPNVATIPGPTFAFAHIIAPHPPYQFDRHGQRRDDLDQKSRESYVGQLVHVNQKVQAAVDAILARSATPPIIIVQSDHGSGFFSLQPVSAADDEPEYFQERLPILNAYLVPESMRGKLYPTISPVNTFRLLLSECFQGDYLPLPERHYIGFRANPQVVEVTDQVDGGMPLQLATPPRGTRQHR